MEDRPMSDAAESDKAGDRAGADTLRQGVTEVITMSLALGGTIARLAAEATAGGRPVARPPDSGNPLNVIVHYGIASAVNVVNAMVQGVDEVRTAAAGAPSSPPAATAPPAAAGGPAQMPTVRCGASLRLPMSIQNPAAEPMSDLVFVCLGVRGEGIAGVPAGRALDASNVRFAPPVLSVAPYDFEKLTVTIDVPADAAPGRYEVAIGLATGGFESAIALQVVPGEGAS
jgi:hypothetical protein